MLYLVNKSNLDNFVNLQRTYFPLLIARHYYYFLGPFSSKVDGLTKVDRNFTFENLKEGDEELV
jgi:hypothetical protein